MKTKLVAHRGESVIAPENTLEAFALAWARGAEAIEGDFHLTKDGEVVCMHDDNTLRTTGVPGKIAEKTLAELRELDAGRWKGENWRYARIPTLREVLETIPCGGEIFIELKSVGPIVEAIRKVFGEVPCKPEQLTFIAFDEFTAGEVKRLFPGHKSHWLLGNWRDERPRFAPEELAEKVASMGVDGVDIQYHAELLTCDYVEAMHRRGKEFHVWTVDDPAAARKLMEFGVDSVTTNCRRVIEMEA